MVPFSSVFKIRKDRDILREQILRVERYNESIAHDIATKRRETHKTEEAISGAEKEKKEQDFLIDSLYQQKKTLENDIALLESRIQQQKSESQIAQATLSEANAEIEATNYEKKILQERWKSSLIGTQRRDEALKAIDDGIQKQSEQMKEIENEIEGYKHSINAEKEKHEHLTSVLIRLENEKQYLDRQLENLHEAHEQMQSQYSNYQLTLDKTEAEIVREEQQSRIIRQRIDVLDNRCVAISSETKGLEDSLMAKYSDQTTFKKGVQNTLRTIKHLNTSAREKEIEVAQVENEIERIHIDLLQKREHIKILQEMLQSVEEELQNKDKMIERYQLEIRRRHDDIEKKQSNLDLLNRTLEKYKSGNEEENLGPLEATIKNLSNSITNKGRENERMKKIWIRQQKELVNQLEENERMAEDLRDAKTRQTILLQKKIRLENQARSEEKEIAKYEGDISRMHQELLKLNTIISKNATTQKDLANANFDLENQILDNLKVRDLNSINEQYRASNEYNFNNRTKSSKRLSSRIPCVARKRRNSDFSTN